MKKIISFVGIAFYVAVLQAQTWIWYPGDYEIWLGNRMNNRRTERGAFFPPFWKTDSHYVVIEFSKQVDLERAENIFITAEGKYNVKLDGKLQFGMPSTLTLPAGKHNLNIKVWNQATPPAIYVEGKTIHSDSSWKVTYEDKEWIDESGKASDTSATVYMNAGYWNFDRADQRPSQFMLCREPLQAVSREKSSKGELLDFGKETFGYITFKNLSGKGSLSLYYGESKEEALDTAYCETLDRIQLRAGKVIDLATNEISAAGDFCLGNSKAFRYVYIEKEPDVQFDNVGMEYEYLPVEYRGAFRCNDEEVNRIWEVGAYTMHLTTREFFIDGIKRDRWVWSGDAIQSYLMNYYLFFDSDAVKRTIWLLRGKDPVTSHSNTIMDYTFYWFLSIYHYYMYTGDKAFVAQIYPRMQTMMEYVLGRTNENGMVEGLAGDWVFVDWADGYLDKKGELSFEQILLCKSLETMALCARLLDQQDDRDRYSGMATSLRAKLEPFFWDDTRKAMVHNRIDGIQSKSVTRYSNMFSVIFGYSDAGKQEDIKQNVLLNDSILKITTPYMRFYELEALCALGEQELVMQEIKDYWGGMLREGATSFWEKYNPEETGTQHLAMYGRPYGKSLCHAWGASPIYLLGKYYLGVTPEEAGYREFRIAPNLGGLKWMEGSVPTPNGDISVYMDTSHIKVKAGEGKGYLYFTSRKTPKSNIGKVEKLGGNQYRLRVDTKDEVRVSYR
ncbi:Bacterial alpha-L-rhamnosidase 6 hairpin glycosidase domain protein [Bacteroides salyersiae]|uniref:alpha-L-rhamnosidase-related protein n=1 Tax=Bacteroides salyersiae TaxID=291644 RepID=UPI001898830F|nr:alpha-L-rhamnosidase C-terminal domain-containing protein [Bacteroides salyersiae]MCS2406146.1 alpha-rhamnosidase [Bacteroides salyersiae]QUT77830.1 Bacterial alpha-L-rhamnosidase 6 hairpin glycosidase domain protein [Bacteroides salyersiae]